MFQSCWLRRRIAPASAALLTLFPSIVCAQVYDPMQAAFPAEAWQQPTAQPATQLDFNTLALHSFSPSYVQTDRLLAALKALNYSVVEFSAAPGPSSLEQIFSPAAAGQSLPLIISLPAAQKTSLMDAPGQQAMSGPNSGYGSAGSTTGGSMSSNSSVPDIGGTYLHGITSAAAQQRLLVAYDPEQPETLQILLDRIRNHIDVPARQIVIEALVIEVNKDKVRDIGINFSSADGRWTGDFQRDEAGSQLPLILGFSDQVDALGEFQARIRALVSKGEAEILSNPSVMVLDGRQARIQVGQQIPVTNSTTTASFVQQAIEYFPVGIVLNLRPRINADLNEVSMQVETIVSSVTQRGIGLSVDSDVVVAPVVDNRQVQTYVRVADNTPFIIGGLISTENARSKQGVPFLSELPLIGSLFRRSVNSRVKNEVIVVLTPHIVPLHDSSFSHVRPKDSAIFESSENQLFRDTYRLRSGEVFDLAYIRDSAVLDAMRERARSIAELDPERRYEPQIAALLEGKIPGEDILARRMLWETVRNRKYERFIDLRKIVFFEQVDEEMKGYRFSFLQQKLQGLKRQALVLGFKPESGADFAQPAASVRRLSGDSPEVEQLIGFQPVDASGAGETHIVLNGQDDQSTSGLDWLRGALIMKWIIDLNPNLPMTLDAIYTGRQIVYPTREDLSEGFHFIDRRTARYWNELQHYYPAFESEMNRSLRAVGMSSDVPEQAQSSGRSTRVARGPRQRPRR